MPPHNLLVFSDVHLGSDLVHRARPDAPRRSISSRKLDRALSSLLDWYAERREGGLPWRLVIAGDLVDFAGMAVELMPEEVAIEPTDEEREHGLGSSADHTVAKLWRVAAHHWEVFAALARFVRAGHTMVVIRGNHDVDFHWRPVQEAFVEILASHGADASRGQVEFSDWFYYEEGLVYVEHGHQYDDYCSYQNVLHPVRASDPRRSERSVADILLRHVVRPTRGLRESGHEAASALGYLRFGFGLGARGVVALGARFAHAVGMLIGLWREHLSGATQWIRREHDRKMAMLAEARHISLVKLRALASLQRPPVTRSLFKLLTGMMVDRVAFAALVFAGLLWLLIARWTPALGIGIGAGLSLTMLAAFLVRRARGAVDATESLRERAARVSAVLPTALVVMGHTHTPEVRRMPTGDSYVNLGAWAEEEAESGVPIEPASQTHLVVRFEADRPVASLLRWDPDRGPTPFVSWDASEPSVDGSVVRT